MPEIKKTDCHLTELILSIQNEVQSAVDYISTMSSLEGTELGESDSVMNIENVKIKLPFNVELEQKMSTAKSDVKEVLGIDKLRANLLNRKGFMVDVGKKGKLAMYSKVKVLNLSSETKTTDTTSSEIAKGEIEIIFAPLRRD